MDKDTPFFSDRPKPSDDEGEFNVPYVERLGVSGWSNVDDEPGGESTPETPDDEPVIAEELGRVAASNAVYEEIIGTPVGYDITKPKTEPLKKPRKQKSHPVTVALDPKLATSYRLAELNKQLAEEIAGEDTHLVVNPDGSVTIANKKNMT